MKTKFTNRVAVYTVIITVLLGSLFAAFKSATNTVAVTTPVTDTVYVQPQLPVGVFPWTVRSIDTQVISKHWPNLTREFIHEQVILLKGLGVNYIAIGTPYDKPEEMKMWADEIHDAGLNVWFRSHWAEWEGDEGLPAVMTPKEYLDSTNQFIRNNKDMFKSGDAFTVAVEPEQVGIGIGNRFLTWDEYREFLITEIATANESFKSIGMEGQIHTNWLSVNGWVVENQFTQELVDQLGLIVVDHYVAQSNTIGQADNVDEIVEKTVADLDKYNKKWKKPILLGEWGYQIYQPVPDDVQAKVVEKMFEKLKTRDYLVGVSYWTHMGNSASIIADDYGSNLRYREAAIVIKRYYDPFSGINLP